MKISSRFKILSSVSLSNLVVRIRHSGYDELSSYLNIKSINERRSYLHYKFLQKIINNLIDCPNLKEQLNFRISIKLIKNHNTFKINNTFKSYLKSFHRLLCTAGVRKYFRDYFYLIINYLHYIKCKFILIKLQNVIFLTFVILAIVFYRNV